MFISGSFFTGIGAFLKLGSFGLGFGVEKNDESDFASLTAPAFVAAVMVLTVGGVTAVFFAGGPGFGGGSDGFLFFIFKSSTDDNQTSRQSRGQNGTTN